MYKVCVPNVCIPKVCTVWLFMISAAVLVSIRPYEARNLNFHKWLKSVQVVFLDKKIN